MIMSKTWMLEHGSSQMAHLVRLLTSELAETDPSKRDVVSICRLENAINFHDTVLCLIQVLPETLDIDLKNLYNDIERAVKESEEIASAATETSPNV